MKKGTNVQVGEVLVRFSDTAIRNQLESSSISIQQAQVTLENAMSSLEHYSITAPISGTVVSREVKAGDSLGNGSGTASMAVIYDLSALVFTIPLDELDVSKVSVGQKVDVKVDALGGRQFEGSVTKISIVGTTEKGKTAYPVTVKIQDPPKELMPGMNVNATIVIANAENVLTVPITAVQFGDVVYVRDKEGKNNGGEDPEGAPPGFRSVNVVTGLSDGKYVEIKSGLNENDEVWLPNEGSSGGPEDNGEGDGAVSGGMSGEMVMG